MSLALDANTRHQLGLTTTPYEPTVEVGVSKLLPSLVPNSDASTKSKVPYIALASAALAAAAYFAYRAVKHTSRPGRDVPGREKEMIKHVFANATEGDVESVIKTIDEYCWASHWMMNVGDQKGLILDTELRQKQPRVVVELGGYCGYSALRIGRLLPAGGHLYSIEIDAFHAAIATKVLEFAGLRDRVTVVVGTVSTVLEKLRTKYGVDTIDLLFVDHIKSAYKSDVNLLEQAGYIKPGSVIVADNCLYPGAPDYVEYIKAEEGRTYKSICHETMLEYNSTTPDHVWVSTRLK